MGFNNVKLFSFQGSAKKMPPQKTLILSGLFACLGAKKVHGSFIDAKPDFWPYVGPEVATAHFSPNFESDFKNISPNSGKPLSPGNKKIKKSTDNFQKIFFRNEKRWTGLVPEDDEDEK